MAEALIMNGTEMDVNALKIVAPRANKGGRGKTARIMAPTGTSLHFSAPLMLTWGVNDYESEDGTHKYSIPLQFPQEQYANENQRKFLDVMKEFENRILDEAVSHSKEWFNKAKMTRDVAEALWTPILKYPKDKETGEADLSRSPTMKLAIRFWDDKFGTELYDVKGKYLFNPAHQDREDYPTPVDVIHKGSHVACVVQCNGIWFAGGKFGVKFTLQQAIVRQPVKIQGSCFVPLNSVDKALIDDENRREEDTTSKDVAEDDVDEAEAEEEVAEIVEDDEVEEPEPEPEPKPANKRKIGKKKLGKKKSTE